MQGMNHLHHVALRMQVGSFGTWVVRIAQGALCAAAIPAKAATDTKLQALTAGCSTHHVPKPTNGIS
jgi:hypothetical protein